MYIMVVGMLGKTWRERKGISKAAKDLPKRRKLGLSGSEHARCFKSMNTTRTVFTQNFLIWNEGNRSKQLIICVTKR